MKTTLPIVVVLAIIGSQCHAQEQTPATGAFDAISKNQTIEQRKKILDEHNLEHLVRQQYKNGAKYLSIAGFALVCPGADHRRINRDQMIIAPMTGCTTEEPEEWREIASSYALRWNLLMRHFEAEQNPKYKSVVSFAEIQSYYRIHDTAFKSLSLESKLLMQYTITQLILAKNRTIELEMKLEEYDPFFDIPDGFKNK
jgi:hypothetical protein